jgi:hypothetical protein
MSLPKGALNKLAVPGLIGVVLAGIGVATIVVAERALEERQAQRKAAVASRQAVQLKLARATDEEREIRETLADYRKLLDRGVIGDEQRLEWVEAIGRIKSARKLFEIKYSIQPQRTLSYPGITSSEDIEFLVSSMTLDLLLLHEGDLLVFLEDLQQELKGHVSLRSCTMERLDRSTTIERGVAPRLKANCVVDLITIRDKKFNRPGSIS